MNVLLLSDHDHPEDVYDLTLNSVGMKAHSERSVANWLRVLDTGATFRTIAVRSLPGADTVAFAARLDSILAEEGRVDVVLINAGLQDCFAMMTGTAPPPADMIASFEAMTEKLLACGMIPVFVVPPPSSHFANGLFADRYIAIAATLRRMARQDGRIGLVDATHALVGKRARGIEPDPRFVASDEPGDLSAHGAFRFAQAIMDGLAKRLPPDRAGSEADEGPAEVALNPNPPLAGSGGRLSGAGLAGACAYETIIESHGLTGVGVTTETGLPSSPEKGLRLRFGGRSSSSWGFVKLSQLVYETRLASLSPGDTIQASCRFSLRAPVENIVAVSLQLVPVWANGYTALHSGHYPGGPGVPEPYDGLVRTPPFALPARLTKLGVSLTVNVLPGVDLPVSGLLDIERIMVSRTARSQ